MFTIDGSKPSIERFLRYTGKATASKVNLNAVKRRMKWTLQEITYMKTILNKNHTQIHAFFPYRSFISVKTKVVRLKKLVGFPLSK